MNTQKLFSLLLLCSFTCAGITTYANPNWFDLRELINQNNKKTPPTNKTPLLADFREQQTIELPAQSPTKRTSIDSNGSSTSTSSTSSPRDLFNTSFDSSSSTSSSERELSDTEQAQLILSQVNQGVPSLEQKGRSASDTSELERAVEPHIKNAQLKRNKSTGSISASLKNRPDITEHMRKAYDGDWQYFKDIFTKKSKFNKLKNFLRDSEGDILALDKNKNTILHYILDGPKKTNKMLTAYWFLKYATTHLDKGKQKNLILQKNSNSEMVSDILMREYQQKPFDESDPESNTIPSIYYAFYRNDIFDPRVYPDVLSWAIARNKIPDVTYLINWRSKAQSMRYNPLQKDMMDVLPAEYAKTHDMKALLNKLNVLHAKRTALINKKMLRK